MDPKDCANRSVRQALPFSAPNAGGSIRSTQCCPAFRERSCLLPGLEECWFCCYADFPPDHPRTLAVGICRWPDCP